MLARIIGLALGISWVGISGCGESAAHGPFDLARLDEAWDEFNDPANLRDQYEVRLSTLPLAAELDVKPWTDTYWPSHRGGLADRWNDPNRPSAFLYPLSDLQQLQTLSFEDMKHLSPAEKYDIYLGRLDYPLVQSERHRTSPDDPSWFGLCHGWAPAALNFKEPKPVTMTAASGLQVPFGSSDVKALLLFAQQYGRDEHVAGRRCNADGNTPECKDLNAGSFHVILANQIALVKQGFVGEVSRTEQVWNQPVFGYRSTVLSESDDVYASAAPGTVRIVNMQTEMRYITEVGPRWEPLPFDDNPYQEDSRRYEYSLELNARGEIIGGEWRTEDHPDFFWTQGKPELTGYFQGVKQIYEASLRGEPN